jgi:prepilin-type N-terminal cleavage/methylation domain-containing protein
MRRSSGFTLLEISIAAALFAVIIGLSFGVAVETTQLFADTDVDAIVQRDAVHTFQRLRQILRESGWSVQGSKTYPRVLNGGAKLEFRVLVDSDGNGSVFNDATGELEWSDNVFCAAAASAEKKLRILDGSQEVWTTGSHVKSVRYQTYLDDSTLEYPELRVTVETSRQAPDGETSEYKFSGIVRMRN